MQQSLVQEHLSVPHFLTSYLVETSRNSYRYFFFHRLRQWIEFVRQFTAIAIVGSSASSAFVSPKSEPSYVYDEKKKIWIPFG